MKSMREWMATGGTQQARANMDPSPVDHDIEAELRQKVRTILDSDRFRLTPRGELMDKMKSAISMTIAAAGGEAQKPTSASDVDPNLRDELGPKVERILDMEAYKSEPREELERKIISAVYKLVASLSAGAPRTQEDPVAKEWTAVPPLLKWVEENERGDALSEPQHEKGEISMDLKSVVEKRLIQLAVELETDGKGSRQEVLVAMKSVVDAASKGSAAQPQQASQQGSVQPQQANQA